MEDLLLGLSYFVDCHSIPGELNPLFYKVPCSKSSSACLQNVPLCSIRRWKELEGGYHLSHVTFWPCRLPSFFPLCALGCLRAADDSKGAVKHWGDHGHEKISEVRNGTRLPCQWAALLRETASDLHCCFFFSLLYHITVWNNYVSAWSFFMVHFYQQMLFLDLIRPWNLPQSYSRTAE